MHYFAHIPHTSRSTSRSATISLPLAGARLDCWLTKVGVWAPHVRHFLHQLKNPLPPPNWKDMSVPCCHPGFITTPCHSQPSFGIHDPLPYIPIHGGDVGEQPQNPPNYHPSDHIIPTSHQFIIRPTPWTMPPTVAYHNCSNDNKIRRQYKKQLNKIEGWSRDGSAKKYTNKILTWSL